jgi:hypothetical protein
MTISNEGLALPDGTHKEWPWQIKGCAPCLDSKQCPASGETEHLCAGRPGFGASGDIMPEWSQNQIRMTGKVDTLKLER